MKFIQAILAVAAVLQMVDADDLGMTRGHRNLPVSFSSNKMATNSWDEKLGHGADECNGAVCGMWGDPHMYTCDGLGYDCMVPGLMLLMNNFMFKIQARFQHVGAREMAKVLGWNKFAATITTGIAIEIVEGADENNPREEGRLFQFSFPEDTQYSEDEAPSEYGCLVDWIYTYDIKKNQFKAKGEQLGGDRGLVQNSIPDLVSCRKTCEEQNGCTQFYFSADKNCHMFNEKAVLAHKPTAWSRTLAGDVNNCGHQHLYESKSPDKDKTILIGNGTGINKRKNARKYDQQCPLLFYVDGVLQDLSKKQQNDKDKPGLGAGYIYGSEDTDVSIRKDDWNRIFLKYKTESGSIAEAYIETNGEGPGEQFGCQLNFFICLPKDKKEEFKDSVGLYGSPDGDRSNDWKYPDGTIAEPKNNQGRDAYEYCRDSWCVNEEDSIYMPNANMNFKSIACSDAKPYEPINKDACVLAWEKIEEKCKDENLMQHPCEMECCMGGCELFDEQKDSVEETKKLSDETEGNDVFFDSPRNDDEGDPLCDEEDGSFTGTGENVCPDSRDSIVKLIHKAPGLPDLPEGQPVIYGISFSEDADDDRGREVSFRVDNPYNAAADVYVRYQKSVGQFATDPACEKMLNAPATCDANASKITVGCIQNPGMPSFALVDVYFAQRGLPGNGHVEKCCYPEAYDDDIGVLKYTFKIKCGCPEDSAE